MNWMKKSLSKVVLLCVGAIFIASCANTKISQSWVEPNNKKSYNDLLIIAIAESEQNRRAYESHFVEVLKAQGIEAIASYKLIKSSEKIERDVIAKAIKGLDIDGVIVTHLVGVNEETVYRPATGYGYGGYGGIRHGGGHYGGLYSYYPHVSSYAATPGYYTTHETYTLETNLYDVTSENLVWSARSRSFAPESVQEVIVDLIKLLVDDLQQNNLIKKK